MINKNKPNVITVTGSVKITSTGFTNIFKIDKIKLAVMAAPMLLT